MTHPAPAARRIDYAGDLPLTARNAGLDDLADMLRTQHARKLDIVTPATQLTSEHGLWIISGAEPVMDTDGVTTADGVYRPTRVADEGLADKLRIPLGYLRRLRAERPDLYDANVNGLLRGGDWLRDLGYQPHGDELADIEADSRSFLVRCFRGDGEDGDGRYGIARALLSDRYKIVDHLDVLMAALDGVRQSGAEVEVSAADLTDRRMMVRLSSPAIRELAPDLLGDYRSPFTGQTGADNPVVSAGFVISNSETGGGAFTITPRLVIEVCSNGMTVTRDALRSIHIGGQMDDGVIRWSDETQQRNLELVASQTRDAVATFLDTAYVRAKLDEMREHAGKPVDRPADVVTQVAKSLRFDQATADGILDHFIRGGQTTAGGVAQAVTSYAQTLDDADTAADVEASALDAMALAAR